VCKSEKTRTERGGEGRRNKWREEGEKKVRILLDISVPPLGYDLIATTSLNKALCPTITTLSIRALTDEFGENTIQDKTKILFDDCFISLLYTVGLYFAWFLHYQTNIKNISNVNWSYTYFLF
jgi:hypothetical protein